MENEVNKFAIKYRPVRISDFVGNESVLQEVKTFLKNKTTPSCILITGETGCGKTTLARIIARYVNKVKETTPMNDVIEIDVGKSGTVSATDSWLQQTQYLPRNPNHKKIFILDEAHGLTKASSTGLLKMLEEPKPHNIFILCTNEPQSLSATLRGRCITLDLKPYNENDVVGMLQAVCTQEGLNLQPSDLHNISMATANQPREAMNLLQKISYRFKEGEEVNIESFIQESCTAVSESNTFITSIYNRDLISFLAIVSKMDCNAVLNLALACNRELVALAYSKEMNVTPKHAVIYPYICVFNALPKFSYRFALYVHKTLTKIKTTGMITTCYKDVIISEFYDLFKEVK